jgi:hypothetical protein
MTIAKTVVNLIMKQNVDKLTNLLLDAVEKAIYPAMIKRSWIENFIRPVIKEFFETN